MTSFTAWDAHLGSGGTVLQEMGPTTSTLEAKLTHSPTKWPRRGGEEGVSPSPSLIPLPQRWCWAPARPPGILATRSTARLHTPCFPNHLSRLEPTVQTLLPSSPATKRGPRPLWNSLLGLRWADPAQPCNPAPESTGRRKESSWSFSKNTARKQRPHTSFESNF